MEQVNQTEEFFKKLASESKKRQEQIKRQTLNKIGASLSDNYKKDFAERIFDLAECYERRNQQDALQKECQIKGHNYGPWIEYSNYWERICKRCGNINRSLTKPQTKIRGLFRKHKD